MAQTPAMARPAMIQSQQRGLMMLHECRVQAQLAELETQLAAQGGAVDSATKSMAQASLDQCSYPEPSCEASAARSLTMLLECRVQAQLAELQTQLGAAGRAADPAGCAERSCRRRHQVHGPSKP